MHLGQSTFEIEFPELFMMSEFKNRRRHVLMTRSFELFRSSLKKLGLVGGKAPEV